MTIEIMPVTLSKWESYLEEKKKKKEKKTKKRENVINQVLFCKKEKERKNGKGKLGKLDKRFVLQIAIFESEIRLFPGTPIGLIIKVDIGPLLGLLCDILWLFVPLEPRKIFLMKAP